MSQGDVGNLAYKEWPGYRLVYRSLHNDMPDEKKPKKDKKLFELGPMEQVLVILGIMAFGTLMMADSCMSNEQVHTHPCHGL